jgi:hypothetical protein
MKVVDYSAASEYSSSYMKEVNKTDRTKQLKGFSKRKIYSKEIIGKYIKDKDVILDYGCGKNPCPIELPEDKKDIYFTRFNHDIGKNTRYPGVTSILPFNFVDIVIVSNVLNVQPDMEHIERVLGEVDFCMKDEGIAIINYPKEPRKAEVLILPTDIMLLLERKFSEVEVIYNCCKRLDTCSSSPIFLVKR